MDKNTIIIYHKEDADGLLSAAICWNGLLGNDKHKIMYMLNDSNNCLNTYIHQFEYNNKNSTEIDLLGTTYAELSGLINQYGSYTNLIDSWSEKYKTIIMTDISFNETGAMKYLADKFNINFIWFDHHAPIINASYKEGFDTVPGSRETHCSAIMHVWKYFYGGLPVEFINNLDDEHIPWIIRALSGYDSFNWEKHGIDFDTVFATSRGFEFYIKKDIKQAIQFASELITYYILHHLIDPELISLDDLDTEQYAFEKTFEDKIEKIKDYGKTIIEYENYNWEYKLKEFGDFNWTLDGHYSGQRKAVALFTQEQTCSTYFKSLKETNPDIQNAIVFRKSNKNDGWSVSVYNINVEDDKIYHVGNYLKKRYKKGGGHAGAGGAILTKLQFSRIMKTKNL